MTQNPTPTQADCPTRQIRLDNGLTQRQLASHLGCDPSYLCMMETGKRPFAAKYAAKMMDLKLLSQSQHETLRQLDDFRKSKMLRAADRRRKNLALDHLSERQREIVCAFARQIVLEALEQEYCGNPEWKTAKEVVEGLSVQAIWGAMIDALKREVAG